MRLIVLCALCLLVSPGTAFAQDEGAAAAPQSPPPPEVPQPAYDVLRIDDGGVARAYRVWEEWVPQIVTTPDGGAWVFFTAQARLPDGFGLRQLYASRFDPEQRWSGCLRARWEAPPPNSARQRPSIARARSISSILTARPTRPNHGASSSTGDLSMAPGRIRRPWRPTPMPDTRCSLRWPSTRSDGLHVVWRDQRFVTPEARAALPTNADLLTSDLVEGEWTSPVQLNIREAPEVNPAWPHLVADGDRLVVIWSIYRGTTAEEMKSAVRVEWSARPLSDPSALGVAAGPVRTARRRRRRPPHRPRGRSPRRRRGHVRPV